MMVEAMTRITILSSEVLADIRSAGWLESDLNSDAGLHRRHQAADICEGDLIDRVWRVLGLCVAHVRMSLRRVLAVEGGGDVSDCLECPERWEFCFRVVPGEQVLALMKEKIHAYMVAMVMADRLGVIMPGTAGPWHKASADAMADLERLAGMSGVAERARRPLWPL